MKKRDNLKPVIAKGAVSIRQMYDFLTGNMDAIATKYGLNKKKLLNLRQSIFQSIEKRSEEQDKAEAETGDKEFILEENGVSEWRHTPVSKAVHRLLNGDDPDQVAKDFGYSTDFLEAMKLLLVRHLLVSSLEHLLENPSDSLPQILRSWAEMHEIECDL